MQQHIHWFPGHMAKAKRLIIDQLKLVDVAIELLDARIPSSSANPILNSLIEHKPRIIALNKADLAEPSQTAAWTAKLAADGTAVISLTTVSGQGIKSLINLVEQKAAPVLQRLAAKGIRPRPVRAIILGIPNSGKSSVINRLRGSAAARTGDRPGVTRGQQWIRIANNLELLDTPGILPPRLDDQHAALKLAVTGAIPEEIYPRDHVIEGLLALLRKFYPDLLTARYKLTNLAQTDLELLTEIGRNRGCLRSAGAIDLDKTAGLIIHEFRTGKLGRVTLDRF